MPRLQLEVNGQVHSVDVPQGQEVTPDYVNSVAAKFGAAASPAKQAESQTSQTTQTSTPSFGGALASAVGERTIDPLMALSSLTTPPRSLGDVGEKALTAAGPIATGAALVAAPWATAGLMGAGALLQAGAESSGFADKDSAQLLAGLAEMGTSVVGGAKRIYGAGRSLVRKGAKEFRALGSAEGKPQMNVARALINETDSVIKRTAEPLRAVFNNIESAADARKLPLSADSPAAGFLSEAVEWATDNGIPLSPRSKKLLKIVQRDMETKGATPLGNVLKLRKSIEVPARTSPDAGASRKLISGFKRRVTQAAEAAMPDEMRTEWDTARNAWRDGVAGPRRSLSYILNKDTPASKAFERIFDVQHPESFQLMTQLAGKSPAARVKLRLGYLETLRRVSANFENTKELQHNFIQSRPMMAASKLFTDSELDELHTLIRRNALARSSNKFYAISAGLAAASGGAGWLSTQDPASAAMAAIAGGAAGQVRMLSLLPLNSPQAKLIGATVGRQINNAAKALNAEYSTVQPEDVDDDDF